MNNQPVSSADTQPAAAPRRERQSNAELLRIVCILFILLHHFCVHALFPEVMDGDLEGYSWDSRLVLFLHGFFYVGVNCFILISGFFGIHASWRGFLRLYLIYAFFALFIPLREAFYLWPVGGASLQLYFIRIYALKVLMPFTHNPLWFMRCYLLLFLFSPILNVFIRIATRRQYHIALALMMVANLYFGFFYGIEDFNETGYSVANFIFLYFIGGYISRYLTGELRSTRRLMLGTYVLWALFWGGLTLMSTTVVPMAHWKVFSYNNPVLLVASVAFFLFMMSFSFHSRVVNYLASSTLAVYLLNELDFPYERLYPLSHAFSPLANIAVWVACVLLFYCAAVAFDQVRKLIAIPVGKLLDRWVAK